MSRAWRSLETFLQDPIETGFFSTDLHYARVILYMTFASVLYGSITVSRNKCIVLLGNQIQNSFIL